MPIPTVSEILLPLLKFTSDMKTHSLKEAIGSLSLTFNLTAEEIMDLQPSGRQTRFEKRVGWARYYLGKAGLVKRIAKGKFKITETGLLVLKESPKKISVKYLESTFT